MIDLNLNKVKKSAKHYYKINMQKGTTLATSVVVAEEDKDDEEVAKISKN